MNYKLWLVFSKIFELNIIDAAVWNQSTGLPSHILKFGKWYIYLIGLVNNLDHHLWEY